MTDGVEIELTKGQAGMKGFSCCSFCQEFIEEIEDSIRIGIDFKYEWFHLSCFIKECKAILEKAGYSSNPSQRNVL